MGEQMSQQAALESVLSAMGEVAIAVSGGVDSLTLAAFAHRLPGLHCVMYHAVSPAVPKEATERTRAMAQRETWTLHVIDAGEFDNVDYMRNPVNRCFYCKASLYGAIRPHTGAQIVSGTNLDDLGEYRPGLLAAKEHGRPEAEVLLIGEVYRYLAALEEIAAFGCSLLAGDPTRIGWDCERLGEPVCASCIAAEAIRGGAGGQAQAPTLPFDDLEATPTQRRLRHETGRRSRE